MSRVSLCMIAKNDAASMTRCLESVAGLVAETIVVDTGSWDPTPAIAQSFGAKVIHHLWKNDYAEARNLGLDQASGEWILVMDAEEELAPASRAHFASQIGGLGQSLAAWVTVRGYLPPGELFPYEETRSLRLFRNRPDIRFEGQVAERIQPALARAGGELAPLPLQIFNHGARTRFTPEGMDRLRANMDLLDRGIAHSPGEGWLHFQRGITLKLLGQNREALEQLLAVLAMEPERLGREAEEILYLKLSQLALLFQENEACRDFALESLACNGDNPFAAYCLAVSSMILGDLTTSCQLFSRLRKDERTPERVVRDLDTLLVHCRQSLGVMY